MKPPCEDCRRNCDEPCWKVEHGILVEVVRCKDCKHLMLQNGYGKCVLFNLYPGGMYYCASGERREGAKNA